MIRHKVFLIFVIPFILLAAHPFDWEIERVDTAGEVGNYPSLELDSLGHPHITYHDATYSPGPRLLKYVWWDGVSWNVDTVDIGDYCGISSSLEFDSLGRPCVAYQLWPEELRYAWWDGNGWVVEIVDTTGFTGFDPTLQFDSNWNPHIAYANMDPSYDLRYAVKQGADWELFLVDNLGQTGYSASFALDVNDTAHICYRQEFAGIVKYAKGTLSGWQISVVDSGPLVGGTISLTLDGQNHPHISYGDYSVLNDMDLRYAKYNGIDWEIEEVDTFDRVGFYSCIAIDQYNRPHISYCDDLDHLGYNLKYAYWTGSSWYIEKVDSAGGDVGWQSSLVFDDGNAFIAYRDREFGDLKYAKARIFGIEENASSSAQDPSISLVCSPNPFSTTTKISYGLGEIGQSTVSIRVYDITGRLVRNLLHAERTNKAELMWHGDDEHGHALAHGLYFILLKCEDNGSTVIQTEKVVIQR